MGSRSGSESKFGSSGPCHPPALRGELARGEQQESGSGWLAPDPVLRRAKSICHVECVDRRNTVGCVIRVCTRYVLMHCSFVCNQEIDFSMFSKVLYA